MPTKSFKGYLRSEALEFDLESADGKRTLTVHCKPSVPGSVLLDFLSDADVENPGTMARALREVLKACVLEEQWDETKAFMDDPRNGIDIDVLSEVAGWLAETFSGRPTPAPRLSSAG